VIPPLLRQVIAVSHDAGDGVSASTSTRRHDISGSILAVPERSRQAGCAGVHRRRREEAVEGL